MKHNETAARDTRTERDGLVRAPGEVRDAGFEVVICDPHDVRFVGHPASANRHPHEYLSTHPRRGKPLTSGTIVSESTTRANALPNTAPSVPVLSTGSISTFSSTSIGIASIYVFTFRSPAKSQLMRPKPFYHIATSTVKHPSAWLRMSLVHQTKTSRLLLNFVIVWKL